MEHQIFTEADYPVIDRHKLRYLLYEILEYTITHKGVTTTYGCAPQWSIWSVQEAMDGRLDGIRPLPDFGRKYRGTGEMMKWWAVRMGAGIAGKDWVLTTQERPHTFYASDEGDDDDTLRCPPSTATLTYQDAISFTHTTHEQHGCNRSYAACLVLYWAMLWKKKNGGLISIEKCI